LRSRAEALEAELPEIEARELTVQTVESIRALSADYESRLAGLVQASEGLVRRLESYQEQSGEEYRRELRARAGTGVSPSGSSVLDSLWSREIDRLLRVYSTDAAYMELRRRADGLERFITDIDSRFETRIVFGGEDPPAWFEGFRLNAARAKREAVLGPILGGLGFDDQGEPADRVAFEARLNERASAFDAWRVEVGELAADMARAESLLERWYTYNEPGPGGESAAMLLGPWRDSPLWTDRVLRDSAGEVFERLNRYASIRGDASELRDKANEALGRDDAMLWCVWLALGEDGTGWPATVGALRRDGEYASRLGLGLDLIEDETRRDVLRERYAERLRSGWARCFAGLEGRAQIREASSLADEFGVEPGALGPRDRYNLLIGRLGALEREIDAGVVSAGVLETVAALRGLMGVQDTEVGGAARGAVGVLTALVPEDGSGRAFDTAVFERLGPASVSDLGMSVSGVAQDGSWVEYSGVFGRRESDRVSIRFERVDDPAGEVPAFYMSVDEIPLQVFGGVVRRAGDPVSLETAWPSLASETWVGPRNWTYTRGTGRFSLNTSDGTGGQMRTPQLIDIDSLVVDGVGEPSWEMPVQAVSPAACELWTSLVGCRLPTAAEWSAANRAFPPEGPNLRDRAWGRQREFVRARRADAPLPWPTEGGYISNRENGETAPVLDSDDGFAFFAPVDSEGAGIRNLVGNVGEVVYLQDSARGALAIIGGSAMTPPSLDPEQPVRVAAEERALARADIGFRLVLPVSGAGGVLKPLSSQLRDVLEGIGFLPR